MSATRCCTIVALYSSPWQTSSQLIACRSDARREPGDQPYRRSRRARSAASPARRGTARWCSPGTDRSQSRSGRQSSHVGVRETEAPARARSLTRVICVEQAAADRSSAIRCRRGSWSRRAVQDPVEAVPGRGLGPDGDRPRKPGAGLAHVTTRPGGALQSSSRSRSTGDRCRC